MICPVCGTANPPTARFCMHCGTALTISPRLTVPPDASPATTRSADQRGDHLADDQSDGIPPSGGEELRHAQTDGFAPAERRIVTILFADLTNSTQLADGMDPEDLRTLLSMFFARMTHEVHRHGGTVEKYVGDAIMAVFGSPVAHEDDPVRAVRAALDMRTALEQFNAELHPQGSDGGGLHIRIGINTGEVVAATGTSATEGHDFLITGDAVNVAARLQQVSEADSILVGPRTYRSTRGSVVYRALAPIQVRGKPRPLRVWEVAALAEAGEIPAARPRGVEGLRAPLVGRDEQVHLLQALFQQSVRDRMIQRVTIVGMPGVGKTRLVREFVNRLVGIGSVAGPDILPSVATTLAAESPEGPLVLEGRCPPYGEGITYWPLAEMLREWCGLSALDTAEYARDQLLGCVTAAFAQTQAQSDPVLNAAYLGYTIGIESAERRRALLPEDRQQLRDGMLRAWRELFRALACMRPLVLVFDDIHWADDALLDLLDEMVERLRGVPILLVCEARPELFERRPSRLSDHDVLLTLEPLGVTQAAELIAALLPGDQIPATLRAGILEKAGGNPFYLEEIIRMLADRGIIFREGRGAGSGEHAARGAVKMATSASAGTGSWRIAPEWASSPELTNPAIPDTVQGVLAARLDLLPSDERLVLQNAAVIGRYFWSSVLQVLAPDTLRADLDAILTRLTQRDLIQESDQDVALTTSGEQIYTFKHVLTREVTYGAIPRARRAHEHEMLARWMESRADEHEDTLTEMIAFHYLQYYLQVDLAHARDGTLRDTVRAKVIHYLILAGDSAVARHNASKAERYFTDALTVLAEAPRADVTLLVHVLSQRGTARWLQSRGDDAWSDYREALRLWEHTGARAQGKATLPPDWGLRGLRLYRLLVQLPTRNASWFVRPPDHQKLLGYLRRGLALADALGQRDSLDGAGLLTAKGFLWWSWAERRGEHELLDALRSASEAVRITEALRAPREASEALDALGNIQATTADLRGHLESQSRRLYWARQIDDISELVDIHKEVSSAYLVIGECELAVAHAHEARDLAVSIHSDLLRAQALQAEVLAYFEWDRWPEAIEAGEQLMTLADLVPIEHGHRQQRALLALATAYALSGRLKEADPVLALLRQERRQPSVLYLAVYRARFAQTHGAFKEAEHRLLNALGYRSGRYALPFLLSELTQLGVRAGQRELFDRFAPQALELGWRSGARKALAQAVRARGMVSLADGLLDDAQADLSDALTRYRSLGTRWEMARTRLMLANLARQRQDQARAHEELTQALGEFELLHAIGDIARTRTALAGGEVRLA